MKDILAISGHPGLFKMISQGNNNIIVESLVTGKRMPAYSTAKVISLEDVAIYTDVDEVPLIKVFRAIKEKEGDNPTINPKLSSNELKAYFEEVLPEYDKERVYVSDIKKVFTWYNLLLEKDMLVLDEDDEETEVADEKVKDEE